MLLSILKDSRDTPQRLSILQILQNFSGEDSLVEPMVALLKDSGPQIRQSAIGILANQGKEATPHLVAALKDKDANVRYAAVLGLQRVPGDLKEALPALVPLLKEGDVWQRRIVIQTLGRVGEPAVAHLIPYLKDNDVNLRMATTDALRTIGPDAKKAIPTLMDMALNDGNPNVRHRAVWAVGQLEPDKIADLFASVKKHKDERVRFSAYQGLAQARLPAKTCLAPLMDGLQDSGWQSRRLCLLAIGNLGTDAKDAAPLVTKLLDDPQPAVRSMAKKVLAQIQSK